MLSRIYSATMLGLQVTKVQVEVDLNQGKPLFVIIGLPSKTVEEAKERITTALRNCYIRIRSKRTIVNLAPADVRKNSSVLELAIAVALLKAYQEVRFETDRTIFFGELSLDGSISKIRGALPLVMAAKNLGFKKVVIPQANQPEVVHVTGITIYPLKHLNQLLELKGHNLILTKMVPQKFQPPSSLNTPAEFIMGQAQAKRALQVAAAGSHHLMMVGPPGSGKTLLAKSITSFLPPLTEAESAQVSSVYSIAGLLENHLINQRPYRAPHHSASLTSILGGTQALKPGEISLAHHGVLFLDEINEFNQSVIESLRQPLEEKQISLTRATGTAIYPADFLLIAASNPCRCGYYGSKYQDCNCTPYSRQQYQKRISGPIMDRIDLHIAVDKVKVEKLTLPIPDDVKQSREQLISARKAQKKRLSKFNKTYNGQLNNKELLVVVNLSPLAEKLLITAAQNLTMSARGFYKVIKVAQTIADLDQAKKIHQHHMAEALQYRSTR